MAAMEPFVSFLGVAALALLVPGPDTFVVLRTSLTDGARSGTWAAAGSATGNLVWGTASAVGVAGLLAASSAAFATVKLAGVAYLMVIGAQALLASARGEPIAPAASSHEQASSVTAFGRGLASDLLNVKVGLFWTALVPQFVAADSSPLLSLAMVAGMAGMAFTWLSGYALLAARMSRTLARRRAARAVNGTVGTVLVALGARLSLTHA